jgi:hypothetical protein
MGLTKLIKTFFRSVTLSPTIFYITPEMLHNILFLVLCQCADHIVHFNVVLEQFNHLNVSVHFSTLIFFFLVLGCRFLILNSNLEKEFYLFSIGYFTTRGAILQMINFTALLLVQVSY